MPFADWRVLELSTSIAASYCGKMFVDAGADVVKIESPRGDPMRYWGASETGGRGALFGFLAAEKPK
jgi:crotonobetainyl-CoA:carnitine CoA-transferase CaiB-like acyl-CoA transferase